MVEHVLGRRGVQDSFGVAMARSLRTEGGVGDDKVRTVAVDVALQPGKDETTEDQRPAPSPVVLVSEDLVPELAGKIRNGLDLPDRARGIGAEPVWATSVVEDLAADRTGSGDDDLERF